MVGRIGQESEADCRLLWEWAYARLDFRAGETPQVPRVLPLLRSPPRPRRPVSFERAGACAALVHEDGYRAHCGSQWITQDQQPARERA